VKGSDELVKDDLLDENGNFKNNENSEAEK